MAAVETSTESIIFTPLLALVLHHIIIANIQDSLNDPLLLVFRGDLSHSGSGWPHVANGRHREVPV